MATMAERGMRTADAAWEIPSERPWYMKLGRLAAANPVGATAFVVCIAFIVLGLMGPSIAPYDPRALDAHHRFEGSSMSHPFGTTQFGEDVFSRTLAGARISLKFGLIIALLGFIPGTVLGMASGYFGRWLDYLIQRSAETWGAIPQLPLLLTFIAAFGPGLKTIALVILIGALFSGSRLLRVVAIVEKHKEYVVAARAMGSSEVRILYREVLPNIMPYILVGLSGVFAVAVLAEAALSFLGLGLKPGEPGWGIDLSVGLSKGASYPHLVIFPGAAISIVVLAFNLLGDTLRDVLDPRLRGSR